MEVNIKGLKQIINFEVVEMKEPFNTFRELLGLRWFFNSNGILDSRKEEIPLVDDNKTMHIPQGERR